MGTRLAALLVLGLAVGGCDHTQPFSVEEPEPLGPIGNTPPIQLTFNLGEDWHPSASEHAILFSRLEAGRSDHDRCIAVLPPGGGTLTAVSCAGGSYPDSLIDAWIEPAPSPDGRLAYVRDQSRRRAYGPFSRHLVVTPLEDPDSIEFELDRFWLEDGRRVTGFQQLSWSPTGMLRFLVGDEEYQAASPYAPADTTFRSYRIVELDIATGVLRELAATEGTFSYTTTPDGGIWMVGNDKRELRYLASNADTTAVVGVYSEQVVSLTSVAGQPTASVQLFVVDPATGDTTATLTELEWLDPATGLPAGRRATPGFASRVAGIPGTQRLVAEISVGDQTSLWMLEIQ